jgi:hypothetical protein
MAKKFTRTTLDKIKNLARKVNKQKSSINQQKNK